MQDKIVSYKTSRVIDQSLGFIESLGYTDPDQPSEDVLFFRAVVQFEGIDERLILVGPTTCQEMNPALEAFIISQALEEAKIKYK